MQYAHGDALLDTVAAQYAILVNRLRAAEAELACAQGWFDATTDPRLVDLAIARVRAAEAARDAALTAVRTAQAAWRLVTPGGAA
jgi:predicted negative regulator of RcsB-dependent stress response